MKPVNRRHAQEFDCAPYSSINLVGWGGGFVTFRVFDDLPLLLRLCEVLCPLEGAKGLAVGQCLDMTGVNSVPACAERFTIHGPRKSNGVRFAW